MRRKIGIDDHEKIYPPWTQQQVDTLNLWQVYSGFHPYTCARGHGEPRALVATMSGWVCEHVGCHHRQHWAHAWTASSDWVFNRDHTSHLRHGHFFRIPWCVTVDDRGEEHDVAFGWTAEQATRRCKDNYCERISREKFVSLTNDEAIERFIGEAPRYGRDGWST